ncbi:MAG: DedA family protein [Alphaproteobacteria bacterium]|nr:DedA family protein [Alphaproteobacteria bacterium]
MIAAASAYHGHISIYYVAIFAATGAIIHDHALYYLGHKLEKRLKDGKKMRHVRRIYNLVDKYGIYFVAMFRFLYGIRTITPIILGASHKFSLKKYSLFVCVSAVLWAVIITYLGYTFAIMFEWLIGEFKRIKSIIFYGVLSALIIATSVYFIRKFAKKNKEDQL